jgi:hypothetical protein
MKGAEGSRRRAPMLVSPRQARSDSKRTGQENFITPVAVSFAAILVTTLILFMIDSYLATESI